MIRARKQPLVLLAEDFEDARELYRDYLQFSGFDVETVNNGREAVTRALELMPDVILMDASMPGVNGLDATRIIKAKPPAPCIVIWTLHTDPQYEAAAVAVGADGFVPKSALTKELLPLIRTLFDLPVT